MYRLLILSLAITLCNAYWHSIHRHYHRRPWHDRRHDRRFERLANHVIAADRYFQGFCRENNNCDAYDVYETQGYKLVYNLPHCSVNFISVKIKQRVLYMSAKQTIRTPAIFVDMRILPDLLRTGEAVWTYDSGKLEIFIPYNRDFQRPWQKSCGDLSTHVIIVPQFGLQLRDRFGDGDGDRTEYTNSTESEEDSSNVPYTGTDSYDTPGLLGDATTNAYEVPEDDRLVFSSQ